MTKTIVRRLTRNTAAGEVTAIELEKPYLEYRGLFFRRLRPCRPNPTVRRYAVLGPEGPIPRGVRLQMKPTWMLFAEANSVITEIEMHPEVLQPVIKLDGGCSLPSDYAHMV